MGGHGGASAAPGAWGWAAESWTTGECPGGVGARASFSPASLAQGVVPFLWPILQELETLDRELEDFVVSEWGLGRLVQEPRTHPCT